MEKSFLEQVGARVTLLRESKGYTIERLSRLCGVVPLVIEATERGYYMPPYSLYEDICRTLGYTTKDLFGCFKWTYTPPTQRKEIDYGEHKETA